MAELRLTGPTEDGDALRLLAPDGAEHALPLTPYLRRLVLEDADASPDDAASAQHDAGPAEEAPEPQTAPASWYDMPEMEEPAEAEEAEGADGADEAAPETDDAGPGPERPDEGLSLTPRIDPQPAGPDETQEGTAPADEAAAAPAVPVALTDQESVKAAATQEAEPLTPREIQQRIRAGASVEQVARESGNPFSRIRTYGHPVLAERGWIAQQAQAVEVWVGGPDLYSDVVEDGGPSTLGRLAAHRLAEIGVDAAGLEWDAWRGEQGAWTVAARFPVAGLTGLPTREQPPALWSFRPAGRHLEPENAWARVLSEAEAWDVFSRADARGPVAVTPEPATAEEEPASHAPDAVTPAGASSPGADRDADLLEILRVRRGQRVGADVESDDALAHLIAREHADRHARVEDDAPRRLAPVDAEGELATAHGTAQPAPSPEDAGAAWPPLRGTGPVDAPAAAGETGVESPLEAPVEIPLETPLEAPEEELAEEELAEESAPRERPARPAMPTVTPRPRARSAARRASVPSWDEIVFGRKDD